MYYVYIFDCPSWVMFLLLPGCDRSTHINIGHYFHDSISLSFTCVSLTPLVSVDLIGFLSLQRDVYYLPTIIMSHSHTLISDSNTRVMAILVFIINSHIMLVSVNTLTVLNNYFQKFLFYGVCFWISDCYVLCCFVISSYMLWWPVTAMWLWLWSWMM
jgi:hypothetical protein